MSCGTYRREQRHLHAAMMRLSSLSFNAVALLVAVQRVDVEPVVQPGTLALVVRVVFDEVVAAGFQRRPSAIQHTVASNLPWRWAGSGDAPACRRGRCRCRRPG